MAIDAIKCYLHNVKYMDSKLFKYGLSGWQYFDNNNKYLISYKITVQGTHLSYKPFSQGGTLSIKFNVAKLIENDNISSVFCFNLQEVFEKLQDNLVGIIDLKYAPHIRFWKVSTFENNINIIRDKSEIKALYNVITKIDKTHSFKLNRIYEEDGTIYFSSGEHLNNRKRVVKFYLKLREIKSNRPEIITENYYNSDIININKGQDILRLEIKTHRDYIAKICKPKVIYSSNPEFYNKTKKKTIKQNIGIFEQIINYDFQLKSLNCIIKEFNLDKVITTKDKLLKYVENTNDLTDNEKPTAKKVIYYLNKKDKYHKKKPSKSSIIKYKNWILQNGYHYLYADEEIQPILLDDIIKQLPQNQQQKIMVYEDSNIYKDMLFYRI